MNVRKKLSSFFLIFVLFIPTFNPWITETYAELGQSEEDSSVQTEELNEEELNESTDSSIENDDDKITEETIEKTDEELDLEEVIGDISILTPEDGLATNETTIIFSGEYTHPSFEEMHLILLKGEEQEKIKIGKYNNGSWNIEVNDLNDGLYEISILGIDRELEIISDIYQLLINTTPPEINIDTPSEEEIVNKLFFTGTTKPLLEVEIFIENDGELIEIDNEEQEVPITVLADEEGFWEYNVNEGLEDGEYSIFTRVEDELGNENSSDIVTFELCTKRPFISPNIFPYSNMTQVPIDTEIVVYYIPQCGGQISQEFLEENKILSVSNSKNGQLVDGTIQYDVETGKITFKPDENLKGTSRYDVVINPEIVDTVGNYIHPRLWSFTTEISSDADSAHASFQSNSNTCVMCHSTHTAESSNLIQVGQHSNELEIDSVEKFCLACHDGTAGTQAVDFNAAHTHNGVLIDKKEGTQKTESCTACHSPHQERDSQRNPFLFQDGFTYTHEDGTFVDSKVTMCETCHGDETLEKLKHEGVTYTIYQYMYNNANVLDQNGNQAYFGNRKENSEHPGSEGSYDLCLRCHNQTYSNKYVGVVDIEQYYSAEKEEISGHFIPRESNRVQDGSMLDGHLACDDCHARHGSDNAYLIKPELGHNNLKEVTWNKNSYKSASSQRQLCLSCHTKKSEFDEIDNPTEIYGIAPIFTDDKFTEDGEQHPHDNTLACSTCHGGGINVPLKERFQRAIHAPIKPSDN